MTDKPIDYYRWHYRTSNPEGKWERLHCNESIENEWIKWKETKDNQVRHIHSYSFGVDSAFIDWPTLTVYELRWNKKLKKNEEIGPIGEIKRCEEQIKYQWYWYNDEKEDNKIWQPFPLLISVEMEEEYLQELAGTRSGQLVHHTVGDGITTLIDFKNMQTYCGSGRCPCTRDEDEANGHSNVRPHNQFKIKRINL